jgi:long-chain acyl-CoA synthetase
MFNDGNLKIIDRKKDLVKLSGGEYVSLANVENNLKLLPFIDNCCVIANPAYSYCVCLICPNTNKLIEILKESNEDLHDLNVDHIKNDKEKNDFLIGLFESKKSIYANLNKQIFNHCMKKKLAKFEIPTKFKFVPEIWLPDTQLVTDSLKIKRKAIEVYYKKSIENLYELF